MKCASAGTLDKQKAVKLPPAIDGKLCKEFLAVAKENGQSQRFSQCCPSPARDAAGSEGYCRSNEEFRDLYRKVAK